jgi:hypothetical protein
MTCYFLVVLIKGRKNILYIMSVFYKNLTVRELFIDDYLHS